MTLSAEEKNAKMSAERAFLTRLLESALKGDFLQLKTAVEDYCRQHDDITASDVLTQFKDGKRRTALHFACQSMPVNSEEEDIVNQILLSNWLPDSSLQIMLRIKDKEGLTPLMLAAQLNDRRLTEKRVMTLIQVGTKAESSSKTHSKLGLARSHTGATALHYAAGSGATAATIQAIYEAGHVAVKTSSRQGGTPLHWACAVAPPKNYSETIQSLLDCGADINASDSSQKIPPPLIMALAAGNDCHAKLLLQQADELEIDLTPTLDFKLPGDVTAIHMAADMNLVGALALLMDNNDKEKVASKKNAEGLSPLDLAAREGHVGCVMLLMPGDNISEQDARAFIENHSIEEIKPTILETSLKPPSNSRPSENVDSKHTEEDAEEKAVSVMAAAAEVRDSRKKVAQELKQKGNGYFAEKDWEAAAKSYSEAIEADPSDATFYSNRSACYMNMARPEDALFDAVIARHLRPNWPKAAYRMAVARLELGRFEDAAMSAWEGLQQDQENDELRSLLQKCVKKGRKEHQESRKKQTDGDEADSLR